MNQISVFRSVLLLCCLGGFTPFGVAEQKLRLIVDPGDHPRKDCPILVTLPGNLTQVAENWTLVEIHDGHRRAVPHQVLPQHSPVLTWILSDETPAKMLRTFEFQPSTQPDTPLHPGLLVQQDHEHLEIRSGEKPVLRYQIARRDPPPGVDQKYGRSGYIHPVWTPGGEIVTDEYPPDHPHQNGIFLANTKTEFEGRQPDFWNLLAGTGFVRFAEVISTEQGPVCGGFRVRHEHVDAGVPDGKVALSEIWTVRVWHAAEQSHAWRFDITSEMKCASSSPLTVKEYHYGGMGFRGARNWIGENIWFTTPEGKSRTEGNHSRIPWVDLTGRTGDRTAGITVFTDPKNLRFPEPVRLHPTMPYFVFTPAVLGDWTIEPGHVQVSRYHYLVHDAGLEKTTAERMWREITEPPRVGMQVVAADK